jgi:hypothetical protein
VDYGRPLPTAGARCGGEPAWTAPFCPPPTRSAAPAYDRDYDLLDEKTDLSFGGEWLASPGTL